MYIYEALKSNLVNIFSSIPSTITSNYIYFNDSINKDVSELTINIIGTRPNIYSFYTTESPTIFIDSNNAPQTKTNYTFDFFQEGSGDPSTTNIRPINPGLEIATESNMVSKIYAGSLNGLTGVTNITKDCYEIYNGEVISGEWWSDRDVYELGTLPTTGAQVVYYNNDTISLTPTEVNRALEALDVPSRIHKLDLSDTALTFFGFISHPEDFVGSVGDTAIFSVEAYGNGATYQWQYKAVSSNNWKNSTSTGFDTNTL